MRQITECSNCGSKSLSWGAFVRASSDIPQGRLRTSDVRGFFSLGCNDCSESLQVVSADEIADHLNGKGANHG